MTLDEILTQYEELWRRAAMEGRPQFAGSACNGIPRHGVGANATCALLIGPSWIDAVKLLSWRCPVCDDFDAGALNEVMLHLNNAHHWTWDMLANKTRDVLAQGGVTITPDGATPGSSR